MGMFSRLVDTLRPSPFFFVELKRQLRRKSGFWVRLLFPLLLLWLIYSHLSWMSYSAKYATITTGYYSQMAERFVENYLWLEHILILVLTPFFVAPFLHAEYQNRSIEWLLITDLAPKEILRDKIRSSLGPLFLLILSGWPILSIMLLFGGVNFLHLSTQILNDVITLYFCAAITATVTVNSKKASSAIAVSLFVIVILKAVMSVTYLISSLVVRGSLFLAVGSGTGPEPLTLLPPWLLLGFLIYIFLKSAASTLVKNVQDGFWLRKTEDETFVITRVTPAAPALIEGSEVKQQIEATRDGKIVETLSISINPYRNIPRVTEQPIRWLIQNFPTMDGYYIMTLPLFVLYIFTTTMAILITLDNATNKGTGLSPLVNYSAVTLFLFSAIILWTYLVVIRRRILDFRQSNFLMEILLLPYSRRELAWEFILAFLLRYQVSLIFLGCMLLFHFLLEPLGTLCHALWLLLLFTLLLSVHTYVCFSGSGKFSNFLMLFLLAFFLIATFPSGYVSFLYLSSSRIDTVQLSLVALLLLAMLTVPILYICVKGTVRSLNRAYG